MDGEKDGWMDSWVEECLGMTAASVAWRASLRERDGGGREGGRETWSTRPILTSKTSQRFSLEKDLDWFSKTFRKKERDKERENSPRGKIL